MAGGRGEAGAGSVVVPVPAKKIGRVGPIRVDGAKRGDARLRDARRGSELGEGWQPCPRPAQRLRRSVAGGSVDDRGQDRANRHRTTIRLRWRGTLVVRRIRIVHHGLEDLRYTPVAHQPWCSVLVFPATDGIYGRHGTRPSPV